jgi:hypothetical protein
MAKAAKNKKKTTAKKTTAKKTPAKKASQAMAPPVKATVGSRRAKASRADDIRLAVTAPVRVTQVAAARARQAPLFKRAFPHPADKE